MRAVQAIRATQGIRAVQATREACSHRDRPSAVVFHTLRRRSRRSDSPELRLRLAQRKRYYRQRTIEVERVRESFF